MLWLENTLAINKLGYYILKSFTLENINIEELISTAGGFTIFSTGG